MSRTRLLTALVLLIGTALGARPAFAQTGSLRVTTPSPTAASLGKFGDVPVSLYTGVPEISIPIFTAKGKTLELPIALKYHAGGIKVEEIGSWVGIGWALDAGGTITRTVRGLVDESAAGYYNTGHVFYNSTNWPAPPEQLLRDIKDGVLDGDPDQFFFSFAGYSGQFVMGPTSTSPTVREVRTIPYRKWKIEPAIASGEILSFVITTEEGTRYTFTAAEGTTDRSSVSPFPGEAQGFSRDGETHKSAWHLTKIHAASGDSITLHYSGPSMTEHVRGRYEERFVRVTNACVPSSVSVVNKYQITPLFVDSIRTAAHTIHFVEGSSLRSDALSPLGTPQEPRLDLIKVTTPTGTVLRQWRFEHDYSTGRLTLRNLYEQDRNGVSLPPYSFTYGGSLPGTSSFAQDHWGFYNAATNSTLIPTVTWGGIVYPGADREPNPIAMKAGSLTRITYPTGGYNELIYESNDYPGWGTITHSANAASSSEQGPVEESFTITGTQWVTVRLEFDFVPSDCQESEHPCPYVELVGHGRWFEAGTYSKQLAPGTYTLLASDDFYPGNSAYISVEWDEPVFINKAAGGLRVAELRTADALGSVSVRKYRYRLQSDTTRSSGIINAEPQYHYEFNDEIGCSYFSRSSMSKIPMGGGPVVGYEEVTVLHGASGEHGRTRHVFQAGGDGGPSAGEWPFFVTTSSAWERGHLLELDEFDNAGRTQQAITSTYRFRDVEPGSEPLTTRRFRGMSIYSWPGIADHDISFFSGEYQVISGWMYQDGETTTVYDTTGTSSFATTKTFEYGNPSHAQLTEVVETNSDGTQRITRMRYPADYATGSGNAEATALTAMQGTAHIHSPVIERWVTKRTGGVDSVVQAELTTFRQNWAGQYLPYQRFMLNSPTPVTNFAPSSVVSGTFTKDGRHLLQETANGYDVAGRLTDLADAKGNITYFQYGGNVNAAFLGWVTRVTDATGNVNLWQGFGYDADGNLEYTLDNNGYPVRFTYDLFGRLRQVKNHDGTVVKAYGYTYSRTGPGWTFNTSSPNAIIDTTFIQHSPTQKAIVSTQFLDGLGRPIQAVVRDGSSYVVRAQQYDGMGRPWRTWKPYTRTTAGYDPNFAANATSFYNTYLGTSAAKPYVDSLYKADALSRVSKVIPEYVGTSPDTFQLHEYGLEAATKQQIVQVTDEMGKKVRRFADVFGNQVKTILGFGATEATTTTLEFDVIGQRRKATDPRGIVTSYSRDTRGLQTSRVNPDGGTVSLKYDKSGNARYSQDANQAGAGQVHFTTWDFANRPLVSGQGPATFSALDPDAASPPALETTQANWLIVREYDGTPDTAVFPWSLFAAEIAASPVYNVAGRLAAVASKSNGAWQVSLSSYDPTGQLSFRYTFTQASGGSVLSALNTVVFYTRDLRGAVTERSLRVGPAGSQTVFNQWYEFDDRGLLSKAFASSGWTKPTTPDVTYTYRPSGELQDRQFQGGPLVPLRYTIRDELERIGDPATTTYPFSARYAYHPNGTVLDAEFYNAGTPAAAKRYVYMFPANRYDALNRMKGADYAEWTGSNWVATPRYDVDLIGYDAAGNITSLQRWDETGNYVDNMYYSYPSGSNRLSSVTDIAGPTAATWDAETGSFTWDANGNLATAPAPYSITAATYDHRNLPLSLTRNGVTANYRYDDQGQRIAKQVGSASAEVYLNEGRTTLGVFTVDGSGTPTAWHFNVLAGDRVIGRQPNSGNRRYYHTDLLGSTRSVVEGTTVVESYDFDPWGVLMPGRTLGSGTKEGFTSKERDAESRLDYFGARYYMPAIGRWTSIDPPADSFPEWSPYNYVLGSPVSLTDPHGLCPPCRNELSSRTIEEEVKFVQSLEPNDPLVRFGIGATSVLAAATLGAAGWPLLARLGTVAPQFATGSGAAAAASGVQIQKAVEQASRLTGAGRQIFEAARQIGNMGLQQGPATQAVKDAVAKLNYEMGGTTTINGVNYIFAKMPMKGVLDAIAVHANGTITRAQFDPTKLQLLRDLGPIAVPK